MMEATFCVIPVRFTDGVLEAAFERLMLEEVFPSVSKKPGRPGQVTGLRLFPGKNPGEGAKDRAYVEVGR